MIRIRASKPSSFLLESEVRASFQPKIVRFEPKTVRFEPVMVKFKLETAKFYNFIQLRNIQNSMMTNQSKR